MSGICEDRVVIVTGAGRGLGRAHARAFAAQGARVVVNDVGVEVDGSGGGNAPGDEVVREITEAGGAAVVHGADVSDWDQARELIDFTVETYGRLDVLVNNAGVVRDRMFVNLAEQEWDDVIRVHLKGHAATMRHAAAHWRERARAGGQVEARVVNTASGAGLLGSIGQSNYAAAKAGIAALTINTAAELGRYGVTVNAIAPAARTRMTEEVFSDTMAAPRTEVFDAMAPENVSPLVVWLGSAESREITGRMFEVEGGTVALATGWRHGPERTASRRWEVEELGAAIKDLVAEAPAPEPAYGAR